MSDTINLVTACFSGISAFAAGIAAWATWRTVREISNQRKTSYLPDITTSQQLIVASATNGHGLYYFWKKERDLLGSEPESQAGYSIALFNVGMGAAKNLHAKWSIDTDEFVQKINALAEQTNSFVQIEYQPDSGMLTIAGTEYITSSHMTILQSKKELGYLLPASIDRTGADLEIPAFIQALYSLRLALATRLAGLSSAKSEHLWHTPTASLSLTYFDVGGSQHDKEFVFSLNLVATSANFFHAVVKLDEHKH